MKNDSISLEDCMQAQEINDDKMDPKYNICSDFTIKHFVDNKIIKLPENLSYQELLTIFANVFQL